MCFMRYGDDLYWARSRKADATSMPFNLLLSVEATDSLKILYITWSVGHGQVQRAFPDRGLPLLPSSIEKEVQVGDPIHLADAGPDVSLFGLILLRRQVKGKRNHLWGLLDEHAGQLPSAWRGVMAYGRTGTMSWE
jgi:hypothetical protein